MAGEEDDGDSADRSEAATPRRLERAREQGQVALSREAVGLGALLLASVAALLLLPPFGAEMLATLRAMLERPHELGMAEGIAGIGWLAMKLIVPVAGAAALGATAATIGQTRGLISAKPLAPRISKISPMAGLKRLVGAEALAEFLRSVLKLSLVCVALWFAMGDIGDLQGALHVPAGAMLQAAAEATRRLMVAALVAFAGIAVMDLVWVHLRHQHMLRMSRQDLRDEAKESDGDPHLRAKRRQIGEARARTRMMAEVPRAAVVITNPTHYAVALAYAGGDAAPKVVAKGMDEMAARIRAAADAAKVPMVHNPPLARALHKLALGAEIPAEHYQAVAEIIAFVWRRRGEATRA
jgi:flagellar biosynthetic protein FlhB